MSEPLGGLWDGGWVMHRVVRSPPTTPDQSDHRGKKRNSCWALFGCTGCISLGDIQNAPTRWVLALFVGVPNSWSVVPNFRSMGGGVGMTPWCVVLVCSWRRLLADRHSLPFPCTLSLRGGGGGMCILFEICEKMPFQKCMGWGQGFFRIIKNQGGGTPPPKPPPPLPRPN